MMSISLNLILMLSILIVSNPEIVQEEEFCVT